MCINHGAEHRITGAVGQEMIDILAERNFPIDRLVLLASEKSAGKRIAFDPNDVAEYLDPNTAADVLAEMDAVANRVRRVSCGWETQLTVAMDGVISRLTMFELCEAFYALQPTTRRCVARSPPA